ncbi:MAG TPA: hypothetical protein VHM24_02535 [Gemmatimonadaceae bacterium]|nr:hypothetical protein [Gemmatimonadaceae bacterium]
MHPSKSNSTNQNVPEVTVVVVAICSIPQLRRSLQALERQDVDRTFEVIVAADSRIAGLSALTPEFPQVRFLSQTGCDTPIELTTLGLMSAAGERIVLTEDSCVARPDWLATIAATSWDGRGAVGGVVEATPGISPAMWAFCYVDFFRYMKPVTEGPAPTLSVCNVAYHMSHLRAVADLWREGFHETVINGALSEKFGPLWLCPMAEVQVRRDVTFGDAVYERYAFGRLFGATRIAHETTGRRLFYATAAPALPFLLMMRMIGKARLDGALRKHFVRALPSILTMVAAWSWGEWLGYVTGRRPARITTAPEIRREGDTPAISPDASLSSKAR